MRISTSILSIFLAGSTIVCAVDLFSKRDLPQTKVVALDNDFAYKALEKCKELGIDPYDEPPKDYDSNDGKKIAFSKGSHYSYWMAAQNALDPGLKKRDSTGIDATKASDIFVLF
ncbi:hypothetical protein BDD12DRAFT_893028 [Trichophaea hybrida]|nr:hypothetical protein BDD12DRAFT_893028 [Trichophaea hybrida]